MCGVIMGYKIFPIESALQASAKILCSWQRHRGYTDDYMGIQTHQSARTWYRRKKQAPEGLTLEDAWRAINALNIPPDDAITLLTGGVAMFKGKKLEVK